MKFYLDMAFLFFSVILISLSIYFPYLLGGWTTLIFNPIIWLYLPCSIFILKSAVIPTLVWILPDQCSLLSSPELCSGWSILKLYSFLRLGLIQLLYVSMLSILAYSSIFSLLYQLLESPISKLDGIYYQTLICEPK